MMLDQYAHKPFQRTKDSTVQHDRNMFVAIFTDISRPEPSGHVQVDLQSAALPVPSDRVTQDKFELGTVKGAFARVVGVVQPGYLERFQQCRFGLIPNGVLAYPYLGTIGKFDTDVIETEVPVNAEDQVAYGD